MELQTRAVWASSCQSLAALPQLVPRPSCHFSGQHYHVSINWLLWWHFWDLLHSDNHLGSYRGIHRWGELLFTHTYIYIYTHIYILKTWDEECMMHVYLPVFPRTRYGNWIEELDHPPSKPHGHAVEEHYLEERKTCNRALHGSQCAGHGKLGHPKESLMVTRSCWQPRKSEPPLPLPVTLRWGDAGALASLPARKCVQLAETKLQLGGGSNGHLHKTCPQWEVLFQGTAAWLAASGWTAFRLEDFGTEFVKQTQLQTKPPRRWDAGTTAELASAGEQIGTRCTRGKTNRQCMERQGGDRVNKQVTLDQQPGTACRAPSQQQRPSRDHHALKATPTKAAMETQLSYPPGSACSSARHLTLAISQEGVLPN